MSVLGKTIDTLKRIKNTIINPTTAISDMEFYPDTTDEDELNEIVFDLYGEWFEHLQPKAVEWKQNRMAYYHANKDYHGGLGTIAGQGEEEAVYCSSIVPDKVDDLAAMQIQSNPTVFPMPEFDVEAGQGFIPPDGMSPQVYLRKIWELCFTDFQERRGIQSQNLIVAKDSRINGIAITKQYVGIDPESMEMDAFSCVVQPENIAFDPSCNYLDWMNGRGVMEQQFLSPMELIKKYPDRREEIIEAIIGGDNEDQEQGTGKKNIPTGGAKNETRNKKGLVCVVEFYCKDHTKKKRKEKIVDPATEIETTVTVEEYKYPNGYRRITFLPDAKVKLKDEENPYGEYPYSVFVANPVSWSVYGKADATPLRHIQVYSDKVFQQGFNNLKQCGNAIMVGNSEALDGMDNGIAKKVPVNHVGEVQYYQAHNIANDMLQMHRALRGEADQVSGIYAPAEGRQTSGLTSGRAIGLLQESTNRKVRPSQLCFEDYLRRQWKQLADLMTVVYKQGRKLRSSDDDGVPATLPFDLAVMTKSVAVRVSSNTQFPVDPMSKFNMFMQLMATKAEDGLPLGDRQSVLEQLNYPGAQDIVQRMAIKAQQNAQMAQGPQGVNAMNALSGNMAMQQAGAGAQQPQPVEAMPDIANQYNA